VPARELTDNLRELAEALGVATDFWDWQGRYCPVDRDSVDLAELFDEEDDAVKWMIESVVTESHKAGVHVGLCGQAPSDHPDFAGFLIECGIDSMSVSPDSFIAVKQRVAAAEAAAVRTA